MRYRKVKVELSISSEVLTTFWKEFRFNHESGIHILDEKYLANEKGFIYAANRLSLR